MSSKSVTIHVVGDLLTIADFKKLHRQMTAPPADSPFELLVIDMENVHEISSYCLSALAKTVRLFKQDGGMFLFKNVQPSVRPRLDHAVREQMGRISGDPYDIS